MIQAPPRRKALTGLDLTFEPRIPAPLPEPTRRALIARPTRGLRDALARRAPHAATDATIIIVMQESLAGLRLCLESIAAHTTDVDYDVQVIVNGPVDGAEALLRQLTAKHSRLTAVFNEQPRGLAGARNQGLALAQGRILLLLGEDTVVPPGWLTTLVTHLEESGPGLIGPVTNRASNQAQVQAAYRTFGEFVTFSKERQGSGLADVRFLDGFCVALRREVFEQVGPFDERVPIGVFQDEDYAVRIRNAGLRVACASDVFVHHSGASIVGHLTLAGIDGEHFQHARREFEAKWSTRWYAYGSTSPIGHAGVRQMRDVLIGAIPAKAQVAIVSRGDQNLIRAVAHGRHFPGLNDGTYAGHHPADSAQAIAHLEAQRSWGVEFLVIPAPSLWWLTYYDEWRRYLESRYRTVVRIEDSCVVFDLKGPPS